MFIGRFDVHDDTVFAESSQSLSLAHILILYNRYASLNSNHFFAHQAVRKVPPNGPVGQHEREKLGDKLLRGVRMQVIRLSAHRYKSPEKMKWVQI